MLTTPSKDVAAVLTVTPLRLLELWWALDHAMQARSKRMLRDLGVTAPQRFVLRKLDERGTLSANEIAHDLFLHPSTMTGILQRLDKAGLLVRTRDASDSRRTLVRLTPKGRKLARKVEGTLEGAFIDIIAKTKKERLPHVVTFLRELVEILEE